MPLTAFQGVWGFGASFRAVNWKHFLKGRSVLIGITNGTEATVHGAILGVWPMPNDMKIHVIPDRFTFDEDTSLKVFLRENTDSPIEIVARNLRKTDSLFVQFLIAAARKWHSAGLGFVVSQVPADIAATLQLLGVGQDELNWQVAA